MIINFNDSETKKNLMRAFAGESQARNRYTFAASQAKTQKLQVLEFVFTYTANQEKAHAEVFYNHLKEAAGDTIQIGGGYPVSIDNDTAKLLRMAVHGETEEWETVYPAFGDKAKEEGFAKIAQDFYHIAAIEKTHADRFRQFAEFMEQNKLFAADVQTAWICLNCGHILQANEAPKQCPVCSHDQGYFIRLTLAPYTQD